MRKFVVILAALSVGSAAAASADRVTGAFRRGDREDLARAAEAAGPRALAAQLGRGDRTSRLAAITAAPDAPDAWIALDALARVAAARDRQLAAAAGRSGVAIARSLAHLDVRERDLPQDALAERLLTWRDVALDVDRWPDVRVHAVETAVALYAALGRGGSPGFLVAPMRDDPEPELRRAALELLPIPASPGLAPIIAELVATDPDADVALVAAQTLCAALAFGDDAAPVLAALGDAGLARVAELVDDPAAPAGAALDAARCLAADDRPASRAALRALASRGPDALRPAVRALIAERP